MLHPDDVESVLAVMRDIAAPPGTILRILWRIRHRDGRWRTFEALARTLASDSAAEGIVINGRDVTEQREAEAALQRSEEHFRALIERSYDLVQVLDQEGRVVYTGPSAERLLGYTPDEISGGAIPDFMHPDDLPAAAALIGRLLANPGTEGSLEYRSLIQAAQDVITVIDAGGVVGFQSPSAERILGFAPEDMVGRDVFEFLHPDDVAMAIDRLGEVMTHPGTVECVQYRSLCKDGSYPYVKSTGRTVLPDSAEAGAVGIVRDISARMEAEAALRQAKADAEQAHEQAERANRATSEFLSRMSHELRTPLNSILGFAQLLEDVELAPEYRTGVRHILNGGRHLLNLINEVLDIARIKADQQPMSLEPMRVQAVVREAVDMVRPLARARRVRIVEAAGDEADRFVRADRQRLT
jgi:PAS domain S-box-containing protein